MAEYYPLIAKAISSFPNSTPETRGLIYERARNALVKQLRGMQPPAPEADIARETRALNDAIARVEAQYAPIPAPDPAPDSTPLPQAAQPEPVSPVPESKAPSPDRTMPLPDAKAPTQEAPGTAAPLTSPSPGHKAETNQLETKPAATAPAQPAAHAAPAQSAAEIPPPRISPPKPMAKPPAESAESGKGIADAKPADGKSGTEFRPAQDGARPNAPVIAPRRRANYRPWILGAASLLLVGGVAGAALLLKGSPEEKSKPKPETAASDPKATGKIGDRVGAGAAPPPVTTITPAKPNQQQAAQQTPAPPQPAPAPQPAAQPQNQAQAQTPPAPPAPAVTQPAVPVALRAALLIAAPTEENKVKTYIGSVIWSPLTKGNATIAHAEVTIPDAQLKFGFNMQKNDDPGLPASHVIDIRFVPEATSPVAAIKDVRLMELRQEEAPGGESLRGQLVPVVANTFMIGLSKVDRDYNRNVELFSQRNWIDVGFLLNDGREAKLTFEKGVPGDQILKDILK